MKINYEKLREHLHKVKKATFYFAVVNTIEYNATILEKYMMQYKEELHPSRMQYFVEWLFNEGKCSYKLIVLENNILFGEFKREPINN